MKTRQERLARELRFEAEVKALGEAAAKISGMGLWTDEAAALAASIERSAAMIGRIIANALSGDESGEIDITPDRFSRAAQGLDDEGGE